MSHLVYVHGQSGRCNGCLGKSPAVEGDGYHRLCDTSAVSSGDNKAKDDGSPEKNFDRLTRIWLARFIKSEVVALKVDGSMTYYVHEEALCNTSKLLTKEIINNEGTKAIIFDNYLNSQGQSVALGSFVQFCYLGDYSAQDVQNVDGLILHARVYILAVAVEAPELQKLALKKATAVCVRAGSGTASKNLNKLMSDVITVVHLVYSLTHDLNTGKMPSAIKDEARHKVSRVPIINRDEFRMLLAKFTASHIARVRMKQDFMSAVRKYPAFGCDVFMFVASGEKISVDDQGSLIL
ncbi:hypothetical protein TWF696_008509 [Orbilia brochopaga]|uniref:BTB domain-containing protein n=1 Tax=Orbilia brochopaga TaxID=3140254 RepID=A0AAV9UJA8_9PEZI